jgi:hypothetical protein
MAITAAAIAAAGVLVAGVTAVSNASTTTQVSNTGHALPGQGGGYGGPDGRGLGGHAHTAVTGTELDTVKAAVKGKDSTISVTSVMKDADGSYDVFGTRSGTQVMVEVSKDLKTIEVHTGGPGGHMGGGTGEQQQAPSTSSSSDSTGSTTSTI